MSGRIITPTDRTFERSQGCWNCAHFENGKMSQDFWFSCKAQDYARLYAEGKVLLPRLGDMERPDGAPSPGSIYDKVEKGVLSGAVGICMKGKRPAEQGGPSGDFTPYNFLCDRWNAKQGASVAREGKAPDKLPGELYEIAESRAKAPIGDKDK